MREVILPVLGAVELRGRGPLVGARVPQRAGLVPGLAPAVEEGAADLVGPGGRGEVDGGMRALEVVAFAHPIRVGELITDGVAQDPGLVAVVAPLVEDRPLDLARTGGRGEVDVSVVELEGVELAHPVRAGQLVTRRVPQRAGLVAVVAPVTEDRAPDLVGTGGRRPVHRGPVLEEVAAPDPVGQTQLITRRVPHEAARTTQRVVVVADRPTHAVPGLRVKRAIRVARGRVGLCRRYPARRRPGLRAPNLGIVTLNGLRISDGYIIPTIPDVLSTYGIPQIQRRVKDFGDSIGEHIAEIGIVITKYRAASTVHRNTISRLRDDDELPIVMDAWIPESNQIASSADFVDYGTLRQKYGYQGQFDTFRTMTEEFIELVEENA